MPTSRATSSIEVAWNPFAKKILAALFRTSCRRVPGLDLEAERPAWRARRGFGAGFSLDFFEGTTNLTERKNIVTEGTAAGGEMPSKHRRTRKKEEFGKTDLLSDEMAGMGFDHQPDEQAGNKVERADGAGRDVNLKGCAGFCANGDYGASGFERFDSAGKNVAGAEEVRRFSGDEDVPGANGDANFTAGCGVTQRDFDFTRGVIERDAHDAVGGAVFHHNGGENIF